MQALGLHHVQITVPRGAEDRARDFYCNLLGPVEVEKPRSLRGRGGLWQQVGDRQVHIGTEDGVDRTVTKAHLAYKVHDLPALRRRLQQAGLSLRKSVPIPGFDRFESRDPFGNRIEFISSKSSESVAGVTDPLVEVRQLSFTYPDASAPALRRVDLNLAAGSRALLVGPNGALLHLLAGHHMVRRDSIDVRGRSPFHDVDLADELGYVGGRFNFDSDVPVTRFLTRLGEQYRQRCRRLAELLEVRGDWRMHTVSDGQRRKVQLLLALVPPRQLLLLDEATADLDVIARDRLLGFLKEEAAVRGVTILYATHIFDGLEHWASEALRLPEAVFSAGYRPPIPGVSWLDHVTFFGDLEIFPATSRVDQAQLAVGQLGLQIRAGAQVDLFGEVLTMQVGFWGSHLTMGAAVRLTLLELEYTYEPTVMADTLCQAGDNCVLEGHSIHFSLRLDTKGKAA